MKTIDNIATLQRYETIVLRSDRLTPVGTDEIREIILEVQDPDFICEINNSFGVLVPGDSRFGHHLHHRLYSVADLPTSKDEKTRITLLVKRCAYIDDFSGEEYAGVASNFLCDRIAGDHVTITGPYQLAFNVPKDPEANMLLIGMGTGIAPFRAFIKHIYQSDIEWKGKVRLFYGAKSGLEMLYMNDENNDLTNYYDNETFKAFQAISPRPQWSDDIALDVTLEDQKEEIKQMLAMNNTHVYVAGLEKVRENLDKAFANILGSEEAWKSRKAELIAGGKWAEVLY
ncbi:ferredoxin-NADP reductase [Persicobacter psychrovividus]|uniref:Ferredoxin--NADP(+) reductase n=1 Tax=Persicobacter psychrovividus TaxID=387638 RepID=A0ABM7VI07_9BACT|nr:ferredoxin--NADP(+) reductase [Persicobacter psychrovividus]